MLILSSYWPSDLSPDLIDFCIAKNTKLDQVSIKSCLDLSSDHSPIIVKLFSKLIPPDQQLYSKKNGLVNLQRKIETLLMSKVPLKTGAHIEKAIVHLNDVIVEASTRTTPVQQNYKVYSTTPDFFIGIL